MILGSVYRVLKSRPASHRLIYLTVANSETRLNRRELIEWTGVSDPIVQQAVSDLRRADFITSEKHPVEGRRQQYDAEPEVSA